MEKFQEDRDEAKKHLQVADHMLTMTYPLVNDPKLLMSVIENLNLALFSAVSSIVNYEREFKAIPPFSDTPGSKFNIFRLRVAGKYNINPDHIQMIEDIQNIIMEHKESPVEFSKKDEFVICTDEFKRLKTISVKEIKDYLAKAKIFIGAISDIVSKNERIFR